MSQDEMERLFGSIQPQKNPPPDPLPEPEPPEDPTYSPLPHKTPRQTAPPMSAPPERKRNPSIVIGQICPIDEKPVQNNTARSSGTQTFESNRSGSGVQTDTRSSGFHFSGLDTQDPQTSRDNLGRRSARTDDSSGGQYDFETSIGGIGGGRDANHRPARLRKSRAAPNPIPNIFARLSHATQRLPWLDIICIGITIAMLAYVIFNFDAVLDSIFALLMPIITHLALVLIGLAVLYLLIRWVSRRLFS